MLNPIESATQELLSARTEARTIDRLPEACRPASNDDALAIQLRVIELMNTTTGSYAGVLQAPLGVPLTVEFGNLGNLSVSFKPK